MRSFLAALTFLTRLGPAVWHGPELFASALPWYPLVGLLVGILCSLPVYLGLFAAYPLVQAWLYILLMFWVTRGLHLDGLADLADAWGSGAEGAKFWDILRDSRCGAFGAMGLALGIFGYMALTYGHIVSGQASALVLAPILGRAAVLPLAAVMPPRDPESLGGLVFAGATIKLGICAMSGIVLLAFLAFSPFRAAILSILLVLVLAALAALARKRGGGNGDFLGCAIVCCELAALLATLP